MTSACSVELSPSLPCTPSMWLSTIRASAKIASFHPCLSCRSARHRLLRMQVGEDDWEQSLEQRLAQISGQADRATEQVKGVVLPLPLAGSSAAQVLHPEQSGCRFHVSVCDGRNQRLQDARCSITMFDLRRVTQLSCFDIWVEAPCGWLGMVSPKTSCRAQAERILHTVLLRRAASAEAPVVDRGDEEEIVPRAAPPERDDPSPPHPAVPDFVQVSVFYHIALHTCECTSPWRRRS